HIRSRHIASTRSACSTRAWATARRACRHSWRSASRTSPAVLRRCRRSTTTGSAASSIPDGLEHDHRGLAVPECGVLVELRLVVAPPRPEPVALLPGRRARPYPPLAADELDRRFRVGLQVEPPRRFRVRPAVHRQGDEVVAVLDIAKDHRAWLPGLATCRGDPHRAPPRPAGTPQACLARQHSVERAMDGPRTPDEPPRR